jgi:hypothetical protein
MMESRPVMIEQATHVTELGGRHAERVTLYLDSKLSGPVATAAAGGK